MRPPIRETFTTPSGADDSGRRGYASGVDSSGGDLKRRPIAARESAWANGGRWTSRTGFDYGAAMASITTPTLWLTGSADRIAPARDVEAFAAAIGGRRDFRHVGRRHGDAIDPDHFGLLTRRELAPMWDELAEYLALASS